MNYMGVRMYTKSHTHEITLDLYLLRRVACDKLK